MEFLTCDLQFNSTNAVNSRIKNTAWMENDFWWNKVAAFHLKILNKISIIYLNFIYLKWNKCQPFWNGTFRKSQFEVQKK